MVKKKKKAGVRQKKTVTRAPKVEPAEVATNVEVNVEAPVEAKVEEQPAPKKRGRPRKNADKESVVEKKKPKEVTHELTVTLTDTEYTRFVVAAKAEGSELEPYATTVFIAGLELLEPAIQGLDAEKTESVEDSADEELDPEFQDAFESFASQRLSA